MVRLNNDWDSLLGDEFQKNYYQQLRQFLKEEYRTKTIYPEIDNIFNALKFTSYEKVRVLILGQDPYINPGEAHGLAFSVQPTAKVPPSLQNIFKELESDIGCFIPDNGHLIHWAQQGVLLLNTILTVEQGRSKSHADIGWEQFTDNIISLINKKDSSVVFMLWGRHAQKKISVINNPYNSNHLILTAAHPSPLAGDRFLGCKHFSKANEFLCAKGYASIDWQIQNIKG